MFGLRSVVMVCLDASQKHQKTVNGGVGNMQSGLLSARLECAERSGLAGSTSYQALISRHSHTAALLYYTPRKPPHLGRGPARVCVQGYCAQCAVHTECLNPGVNDGKIWGR